MAESQIKCRSLASSNQLMEVGPLNLREDPEAAQFLLSVRIADLVRQRLSGRMKLNPSEVT